LAFEPTVHDLSICEKLLDALLDVNTQYLAPDFIEDMRKRKGKKVEIVEAAPDNELRPDVPPPKSPGTLDILAGTFWGSDMGNLNDED
jgi:hypothetical protein